MKRVAWKAAVVAAAMFFPAPVVKAQDSPEAVAQKILAQAREAAGGDAKLKSVQSLSVNGKARRQIRMMMGAGSEPSQPSAPTIQENDFEVDILAPDKYVRRDTREVMNGAATVIIHSGFNGDKPIQRAETIGELPVNPNQMMQGDPATRLRANRQSFLRIWLGFAFEAPAAYALSFRSLGNHSVNNATYDVVEVSGPDNFSAKLYFDAALHRMTMIRYRAPGGQQIMRMGGGPPPGQAPPQGGNPPAGEGQQMVFQRPTGPAAEAEFEIVFSDFKAVDGIQLPHKIRRSMNGEVNDETEIKKYKVNSNPKADKFKTTD
ncbi:MAG: hypothetical protein HY046_05310 [Acidobacteria bacterium]|nr:hypothetical protein [Acidobacteriota bacterium]